MIMEDFRDRLKAHLEQYPGMRPQDCIKLLYQHHFGPGHAISDEEKALENLLQECRDLPQSEEDLFTPIGNWLVRVDLYQAMKQYTPEQINRWSVQTAANCHGSMAEFMQDLKVLKRDIADLPVAFNQEAFDVYLAFYRSKGYPVPHHSKEYRELYAPHYRVLRVNIWNLD